MKIEEMKARYKSQDIPEFALKERINQTIAKKTRQWFGWREITIGVAIIVASFVIAVNTSYQFVNATSRISGLKDLVSLVLVREYKHVDKTSWADIQVPLVAQIDNQKLANKLNTQLMKGVNYILNLNKIQNIEQFDNRLSRCIRIKNWLF